MKTLQTYRLKPNPAGKDKNKSGRAAQSQLGGEWVDIRNTGNAPVSMDGVKLYHVAFVDGKASRWELVTGFSGTLGVGQVIRVHSGSGPASLLHPDDLKGASINAFTGRDAYIWNNAEGDTSRLTELSNGVEVETDKTSYPPHPGEGVVFVRVGASLVPGRIAA